MSQHTTTATTTVTNATTALSALTGERAAERRLFLADLKVPDLVQLGDGSVATFEDVTNAFNNGHDVPGLRGLLQLA